MSDRNSTQIEILERMLFSDAYNRIMAMSQKRSDETLEKVLSDEVNGFVNLSAFEARFVMWHSLSLMVGYDYQPAETQAESDMEAEVYRQFWQALKVLVDKKGDAS